MRLVLPLVALAGLCLPHPASARPVDGEAARAALADDLAAGRIDRETWLLQSFRYAFAPDRLAPRYVPEAATPLRCLTPEVAEYHRHRASLSAGAVAEIEGYLAPRTSGLRATYVSPGGKFSFDYSTTGVDAVSATDTTPANGVPDYVERCAEYMDLSWTQEIDTLGFVGPGLPGDGTYDVSFESMFGVYGYTTFAGSGTTRIVLHNTFNGFPSNTDPDGNQLGAAKVTCAHEFKHASQFSTSGWSEGGWVELDATWAEDIVFPATNDYWNYTNTNGGTVLGQPWTPLDSGGSGSYEDCLWQHWMSGSYGNQIIVDLWEIRDANPAASMKNSYGDALALHGTSWDEAYPGFLEWAWFTGSRAEPSFGFADAPDLKRMNLRGSVITTYPWGTSDSVDQLAGHPFRCNAGSAVGAPRIQFDGVDGHSNFTVSVIVKQPDTFTIVRPPLDANNECDYVVPIPWSGIGYLGVIVTNSKRSGGVQGYTLDVLDETGAVGAPVILAAADRLMQAAPAPNPMHDAARVTFALPRAHRATVRILDVAGRVVRTLVDGNLPAGTHDVTWDGRDAAGRTVAAGVYWSRVESDGASVTRKLTVIR